MKRFLLFLIPLTPIPLNAQECVSGDCENGFGTMKFAEGSTYVGEFKDGLENGQGVYTWPDGKKYEGEVKDGLENGFGTITFLDGSTYVGEFKDDLYNGRGTYTWPDGRMYEGECKNNMRDGYGTYILPDGNKYEGGWKDDLKDGFGILQLPDGTTYVGEFKDGFKNGRGSYTFSVGGTYVGEFKDDKWCGQGTFTYPNGEILEGVWKDNQMNGHGTNTLPDGSTYVGEFKDDFYNGRGTYTWPDGDKETGIWQDGDLIEADEIYAEANNLSTSISKSHLRVRISSLIPDISKVAVIGKESKLCDGNIDNGQGLAELVEGELLGLYGVVERRHLTDILEEQRLAMGGLIFEDSDFAKAGCLTGAQGTVLTSYGCLQGQTKIQVKLVDCSTSDLYWSATGINVSEFELLDELRVKLESR